jgi:hypothetical protein
MATLKKEQKKKEKENQIKDLAQKLGQENLKMNGSTLVDVLNEKYGKKDNDTPFQYGDVQQYYLRGTLPPKYGGLKLELKEGVTGKYLIVYKEGEGPETAKDE